MRIIFEYVRVTCRVNDVFFSNDLRTSYFGRSKLSFFLSRSVEQASFIKFDVEGVLNAAGLRGEIIVTLGCS